MEETSNPFEATSNYSEEAKVLILDYTGLTEYDIDGEMFFNVMITKLANALENRDGTEGETSRSEGNISRTFDTHIIPQGLRKMLDRHVKNKVVRK